MRSNLARIEHMLEAIDRLEQRSACPREEFDRDELLQVWMVHHLQILGEAASRLDRDYTTAHPEVPWSAMIAMRNILVHAYFKIDLDEVWLVVTRDLPPLKKALTKLHAAAEADEGGAP